MVKASVLMGVVLPVIVKLGWPIVDHAERAVPAGARKRRRAVDDEGHGERGAAVEAEGPHPRIR
jgi:hypothetical protein